MKRRGKQNRGMAISLREKRRYGLSGEVVSGDWKYVPKKEDCNDRPNYQFRPYSLPHQSQLHQKNWLKRALL